MDHVCQVKCNGSINFQKSYRTPAGVEKLLEIEKEKQKQKKTHTQTKTKTKKKTIAKHTLTLYEISLQGSKAIM